MRHTAPLARFFNESEEQARARSERDPVTRVRITYAHEHAAAALFGDASHAEALRGGGGATFPNARPGVNLSPGAVKKAGLTMGEARAAGLVKG